MVAQEVDVNSNNRDNNVNAVSGNLFIGDRNVTVHSTIDSEGYAVAAQHHQSKKCVVFHYDFENYVSKISY